MRKSVALVVVLLIGSCASATDWPQWLGPKRDGSSTEVVKPWKEPLKILWKEPVGEAHGGPVVAEGKTYLFYRTPGKDEETLAAYDATKGNIIWKNSYPRPAVNIPFGNGPRGVPTVSGGKVYTFGITGILTCVDAATGKRIWQVDTAKQYNAPPLKFGNSCSPIVGGDHVLVSVGAKGASIVAFNKDTGKEVWRKLDDGASYSSPLGYYHEGSPRVVFLTASGLVSLNPKDGAVLWKYPFADIILESSCTPVVFDGKVFASSITAGSVLLTEDAKVTKVWSNSLNCYFSTPVALGKDTLYMVTGSLLEKTAVLRCVDATNGKQHWSRKNVGKYHATLLGTGDNKMLMVEEKGDLVLFDPNPKQYSELARSKICGNTWAHPALANGRLYIRDAKDLICVELPK